jgi:hypothetical protein
MNGLFDCVSKIVQPFKQYIVGLYLQLSYRFTNISMHGLQVCFSQVDTSSVSIIHELFD